MDLMGAEEEDWWIWFRASAGDESPSQSLHALHWRRLINCVHVRAWSRRLRIKAWMVNKKDKEEDEAVAVDMDGASVQALASATHAMAWGILQENAPTRRKRSRAKMVPRTTGSRNKSANKSRTIHGVLRRQKTKAQLSKC